MQNLDSLGVATSLALFSSQIRDSWSEVFTSDLPKFKPNAVVISGMGGSSNAAKILEGLYEQSDKAPFNIDIYNDYGLPVWVNKDSLVIANSYSGNTEETLSSIEAAKKVGAKIVGIATGGKIADMIKNKEIDGVIIDGKKNNPTGYPKTGLGVSFGALLGVMAKMEIIYINNDELIQVLDDLDEIKKSWNVQEIAEWFNGNLPVLFGGRPFIGSLNAGRNAICEIGRTYTQFYDFPEVNHVLIEATLEPTQAKENNRYLFFESGFNSDRVKLRYRITKEIFDRQNLQYKTCALKGRSPLSQALEIPYFCANIGLQLSLLRGVDPGPEPWILELKEKLLN